MGITEQVRIYSEIGVISEVLRTSQFWQTTKHLHPPDKFCPLLLKSVLKFEEGSQEFLIIIAYYKIEMVINAVRMRNEFIGGVKSEMK